jgi:hypothetical protein
MRGNITRRGKSSWRLKFDTGRDEAGGRKIEYVTVRGTKREAEAKLAELTSAVHQGSFVEPSKVTIAEYVRSRVDQWQAAGTITAPTAKRYRELVENQIVPQIGAKLLQKLRPLDVEAWHNELRTGGRKDRLGGVSARTIGSAHRVLSKALKEAAKRDLVSRNLAAGEPAPKVEAEPMIILTAEQVHDDIVTISRRLGHASPNVTLGIYAHLFRKTDSKAADAINAAMAGICKA